MSQRGSRFGTALLAAVVGAAACATSHPYTEADWGTAPAPYAREVTEITLEHLACPPMASGCSTERLVLRRDGRATREFLTGRRQDSLLAGAVDSAQFVRLADRLTAARFFASDLSGKRHEPLAADSYVATAATLCRRAFRSFTLRETAVALPPPAVDAILATAALVPWSRCCRAVR